MREENEIRDSWASYLSGEAEETPGREILEDDAFREIEQIWELTGTSYSYRKTDTDEAWNVISQKMSQPESLSLKKYALLRYAAIFLALFSIGSLLFFLTRKGELRKEQSMVSATGFQTIQTEAKPVSYSTVVLPDGSTVKLNASTRLQYPEKFTGKERIVRLSGEAYFEILHDDSHPFVVETNHARIEDLGTSFNICAYPGQEKIEVNVTTGSVRLSDRDLKVSSVLVAGTSGKIISRTGKIETSGTLTPNFLAWITREISFKHTPLSQVFEVLQDIYHVPIEFSDPSIAGISYTANFDKFELEEILGVIAKTHHLSVNKKPEGYIFARP